MHVTVCVCVSQEFLYSASRGNNRRLRAMLESGFHPDSADYGEHDCRAGGQGRAGRAGKGRAGRAGSCSRPACLPTLAHLPACLPACRRTHRADAGVREGVQGDCAAAAGGGGRCERQGCLWWHSHVSGTRHSYGCVPCMCHSPHIHRCVDVSEMLSTAQPAAAAQQSAISWILPCSACPALRAASCPCAGGRPASMRRMTASICC